MIALLARTPFRYLGIVVLLVLAACGSGADEGKWTLGSSMFLPRHSFSSTVLNGKFYVFGGWAGDGNTDTVEVYVPETRLWATRTYMPPLLSDSAASGFAETVIITGGRVGAVDRSEHVTDEVWSWNSVDYSWNALPPMPMPRENHVQSVIDETLIVAGGENDDGPVLVTLLYDIDSQTWRVGALLPRPSIEGAMAVWNGVAYLFGGRDTEALKSIFAYDPESDIWEAVGEMPIARYGLGVVSAKDGIHVLGGVGNSVTERHDVFDPDEGVWSTAPELIPPRSHFGTGLIGGDIVVAGGGVNPRGDNETVFSLLELYRLPTP